MLPEDGAEALTKFYIKFGQGRALSLRYDINFNPCEAPTPLHCSLFTLTSPARAVPTDYTVGHYISTVNTA